MTPTLALLILVLVAQAALIEMLRRGLRYGRHLLAFNTPGALDDHLLLCAATVDELFYGIIIVNERGEILLANRAAEKMSGYTKHELVGQKVEMLLPDEKRGPHVDQRENYSIDGGSRPMGSGLDTQMKRKNGTLLPVDIALNTLSMTGIKGGTRHVATIRRRPTA